MSQSRLSYIVSLCQSIEKLNDNGCFQVIRLLQSPSGCHTMNHLVKQIMMNITKTMNVELLQEMDNKVQKMVGNEKYNINNSMDHHTDDDAITIGFSNNKIYKKTTIFPLFRLPKDIIHNTSLYLDEKDVFNFEICCRSFYKMINNLLYLKQSNNFKTFTLNDKRLNQICQASHSFYKYSQASELVITCCIETPDWEKVKKIDTKYDHWLTSLFKSIKSIQLGRDDNISLLPTNILFDSKSQLESMIFNSSGKWNMDAYVGSRDVIVNFDKKCLQLKQKLKEKGKEIKKLEYLEYNANYTSLLQNIEVEHLSVPSVDHDHGNNNSQYNFLSNIHVLTCNDHFNIRLSEAKTPKNCHIGTLRLINFTVRWCPQICVSNKVIEALNLHQNLNNFTLQLQLGNMNPEHPAFKSWMDAIDKILRKEYYHQLKNVNVLLTISNKTVAIEAFFEILKKNCQILKYQFEQLNVGLEISCLTNSSCFAYYVFVWSPTMDKKMLMEHETKLCQTITANAVTRKSELTHDEWQQQWT